MGIFSKIAKAVRSSLSADYGRFERSREVEKAFENFQAPAGFNYYYTGPDACPTAILGIHREYTLRSRFWKKVELTEDQLKGRVEQMGHSIDFAPVPRGFLILDHTGKHIGVFYSPDKTKVRIDADNQVVVEVPKGSARIEQGG